MKTGISRRAVLNGIGQSAALGSLAAVLPQQVFAAQAAAAAAPAAPAGPAPKPIAGVCLTMLYPSGEGLTFDVDGFRDRHVEVLKTAYAGGLERIELRVPPPVPEGRPAPPVLAAVSMWINDIAKFAAGANANAKQVSASMATITKSAPIAQFDNVVTGVGLGRESVPVDSFCFSYWFEAKEGATWGTKAFAENYVPKWLAAYGPEVVRRIEVSQGVQSASGSKPLLLGQVTLYVADETKYDAAKMSEAVKLVEADFGQYYTVAPIQTLMLVRAVG